MVQHGEVVCITLERVPESAGVPSAVPSVVPSASVFPTRPPASASGPNPSGSAPCLSSLEECFRAAVIACLRISEQAAQFGDLWGDDEVLFHLRKLAQGAEASMRW